LDVVDKKVDPGSTTRERAVSEVERLKSVRKERKDFGTFPMIQYEQMVQSDLVPKSILTTFPENDIELTHIDRKQRVVNPKVTVRDF
jgi:hypothetical protein